MIIIRLLIYACIYVLLTLILAIKASLLNIYSVLVEIKKKAPSSAMTSCHTASFPCLLQALLESKTAFASTPK